MISRYSACPSYASPLLARQLFIFDLGKPNFLHRVSKPGEQVGQQSSRHSREIISAILGGAGMAQWLSICLPTQAGFDSRTRRHMWVEFVVGSRPRGFSPVTPVFPSPQKPAFPNSNSIWNPRTTSLLV